MSESADLSKNAAFMDLYSRQIGAFGIETMAKLVNMRILIVGLKGIGIEAAKNLVLAGPGYVILADDGPAEIKDLGTNFFLTEADIGTPRATACATRLQELNGLVKVLVHSGPLSEDLVGSQDVVVMTTTNRHEMIRWNKFCREKKTFTYDTRGRRTSKPTPIRFIAAGGFGASGYIFSDFGPEFTISDATGEPPVQRVITNISCDEEGIVSLLDPSESELAKKADIADTEHEGFISFNEVEGMFCRDEHGIKTWGHSINTSGEWRAKEIWKKVPDYLLVPKSKGGDGERKAVQYWVYDRDKDGNFIKDTDRPDGFAWKTVFDFECHTIPDKDFVRDEYGQKKLRMTEVKEHYKVKIGDTRNYSDYLRGGVIQQVYQPIILHHRSFIDSLQQPIPIDEQTIRPCDGDKDALGWWYPMLHIFHQAIFQFINDNERLPIPNDENDANIIVELAVQLNTSMLTIQKFAGKSAALATVDLSIPPKQPPTTDSLNDSQKEILQSFKDMGSSEERALLVLQEADWNADVAMSLAFDEEALSKLESAVKTYKCLAAIRRLALAAGAEFQPLAVFLGGACAQEVVKHCGKFTPLNQWLLFDCIEVLPIQPLSKAETSPRGSRYDHNISLFGLTTQQKLCDVKTFMVGCGALGCELLKNFALLGLCSGENGLVTVTDGDRIEVSNLNRQFLFRKQHVKKPKSVTAAVAVKGMNPNIHVRALELLASKETEKTFCDDFWLGSGIPNEDGKPVPVSSGTGLNFVVNALDNVKARKYVDSRCVFYQKPLLESGTEGTKFNHMVILPHQTVSYDEGEADAPEGEAIPMCTLRNFPSTIIHCIEWARGLFEDNFVTPLADLLDFLKDPKGYISDLRQRAEAYDMSMSEIQMAMDKLCDNEGNGLIKSAFLARSVKDRGMAACVEIAHSMFTQKFDHAMRDLQHQFPKDLLIKGKPFWSAPKRYPTVLSGSDIDDECIATFLVSVTNLVAVAFGLHPLPVNGIDKNGNDFDTFVSPTSDWRQIQKISTLMPTNTPNWQPSKVKIDSGLAEEDNDTNKTANNVSNVAEETNKLTTLLDRLEDVGFDGLNAQPADFEKDLDLNFHIDFIHAAANLRASNYGIPRCPRHKTKMIAGKIIAAIATSTACATALVCIELVKLVQNKPKDQHRDSSCNFAVNQFQMTEPKSAVVYTGSGETRAVPDAATQPHLFDERGNVKHELVPVKKWKAYPSPHTKWDNISIPSGLTLQQGLEYLSTTHGLKVTAWSVTVSDPEGKSIGKQIYSEMPNDTSVDEELLVRTVSLDESLQKATGSIMRCGEMKNKQAYMSRWKLLKERRGADFQRKMQTPMSELLESHLGSLAGIKAVALEMNLTTSDNGVEVEAVTPPVVLSV